MNEWSGPIDRGNAHYRFADVANRLQRRNPEVNVGRGVHESQKTFDEFGPLILWKFYGSDRCDDLRSKATSLGIG